MPRKTEPRDDLEGDDLGRFNEAAARCRGKLIQPVSPRRSVCCFNEAAARCRGKRTPPGRSSARPSRFNEAAARCRGKRRRTAALRTGDWWLQ